jgi:hypothetical protein
MLKNTLLASLLVAWIAPPPAADEKAVESFELHGAATALDAECVRLTPDAPWASGSAWSKTPLDLAEPFDLRMHLAFGETDALGADGIVFVLGPRRDTGWRGEGIGYAGLRDALGIEIDTYQNWRQGDPSADHLALLAHGHVGHRGSPVVELPNLEDGQKHAFRVTWSPEADALKVFLDGELRATYPGAVVRGVLGEDATVSWGLTAGTGRKTNAHDVCVEG